MCYNLVRFAMLLLVASKQAMPIFRKVASEVAATWDEPAVDEQVPIPADARGLTRMNYLASGSIGWMARVYTLAPPSRTMLAMRAMAGPRRRDRPASSGLPSL